MRTKSRLTSEIAKRVGKLAPLALAIGLAVSASGCIIESSSGGSCLPDLLVPWSVVQETAGGDVLITCAQAGATSVEVDVNGNTFSQTCPPTATSGQLSIRLGGAGTYTLD